MLQEDDYKDVVRWTHDGNSFVVLNTNEFTKDILPRHFKHSNFASFVRQLNKYDFHKVKVSNEEKIHYPYGDDAWEFKHPDFRMNDRDALENIKRKGPSNKKTGDSNSALAPGGANVGCGHNYTQISSSQAQLKDQVDRLTSDNKALHQQLNVLESKYKTLIENIVTINTYNERCHSLVGVLINSLLQNGIKLPLLDFPAPSLVGQQVHSQPLQTLLAQPQVGVSPNSKQFQMRPSPPLSESKGTSNGTSPGIGAQHLVSTPNAVTQKVSPIEAGSMTTENVPSLAPTNGGTGPFPHSKFNVLLVEDDNVCIQLCRKFLVKYGCEVTVVMDGLNAISTVESNTYDLVLMDIVMPNLDGATATSVIRSFDTTTPIIAMTGNIEDNDLVNYLQNGMLDILAKPFTKDDLYSILSKHLSHDDEAPRGEKKPRLQ